MRGNIQDLAKQVEEEISLASASAAQEERKTQAVYRSEVKSLLHRSDRALAEEKRRSLRRQEQQSSKFLSSKCLELQSLKETNRKKETKPPSAAFNVRLSSCL